MAIILPMYANCSLSEVLELKWKSFDVIDNVVIYKRHKDGIAGPIHNFTVPIMPDGSALILKIRNKLLEKYDDIKKLNNHHVICFSNPSEENQILRSTYVILWKKQAWTAALSVLPIRTAKKLEGLG